MEVGVQIPQIPCPLGRITLTLTPRVPQGCQAPVTHRGNLHNNASRVSFPTSLTCSHLLNKLLALRSLTQHLFLGEQSPRAHHLVESVSVEVVGRKGSYHWGWMELSCPLRPHAWTPLSVSTPEVLSSSVLTPELSPMWIFSGYWRKN